MGRFNNQEIANLCEVEPPTLHRWIDKGLWHGITDLDIDGFFVSEDAIKIAVTFFMAWIRTMLKFRNAYEATRFMIQGFENRAPKHGFWILVFNGIKGGVVQGFTGDPKEVKIFGAMPMPNESLWILDVVAFVKNLQKEIDAANREIKDINSAKKIRKTLPKTLVQKVA